MASKSSMVRGMLASRASASRCSTALVEPPVAATAAMAFSNAVRVRIWLGRSTAPQHLHHQLAGAAADLVFARVDGRDAGRAQRREADHLHHRGHGVGGILAAAGARRRGRPRPPVP